MFEIQLPKALVVTFVALSSSLWFTTLLLFSGVIYPDSDSGKMSLEIGRAHV